MSVASCVFANKIKIFLLGLYAEAKSSLAPPHLMSPLGLKVLFYTSLVYGVWGGVTGVIS